MGIKGTDHKVVNKIRNQNKTKLKMYTSFNVSALLACIAFTPLAVKLQEDQPPMIAGMEDINTVSQNENEEMLTTMITDATEEAVEEQEADPQDVLDNFDDTQVALNNAADHIEEAVEEIQGEEGEEDCSCGSGCAVSSCGCDDDKDETVNLPEEVFYDERVELEAENIIEALDPLIIDLTLDDLNMDLLDAQSLEHDVLLPAMQQAIEDMIAADPSLAGQLPDMPTQLESTVDAVMQIIQAYNTTEHELVDGATVTQFSHSGFLDTEEDYETALLFSALTPSVFWFVDDSCSAEGSPCHP